MMTIEQALETIKYEVDEECHCGYIEYELRLAVEALELQIPKKVKYGCDDQDDIKCPKCDYTVGRMDSYFGRSKYCEECGQRLDWSDK